MRTLVWSWCLALASCVSSNVVVCDFGIVCPEAMLCDSAHRMCVTADQVEQCKSMPDRTACMLADGAGNCQQGVCVRGVCGNAVIDLGEACDDGNVDSADGCSFDCTSTEVCGNRIVDLAFGETCDDGEFLEHDGCSSTCHAEEVSWQPGVPPGRGLGCSAYDARLGAVVVFGGVRSDFTVVDEMWQWDGQWEPVPHANGPEPRLECAMAYDAKLDRTILFGGTGIGTLADTWAWDGAGWTRLADGPRLAGASLAYDARRKKLVLFGGYDEAASQPEQNKTWEFDGTTWSQITTATVPVGRFHAAMAYDPERGRIVMFGGHGDYFGPEAFNDLWQYDGVNWSLITQLGTPPPVLEQAGMAFDRASHRIIVFGGADADEITPRQGTYMLANGTTWSTLGATPITSRRAMVLADDGGSGLVLFGGLGASNATPTDTWRWDAGTGWSSTPPLRYLAAVAHDVDRQRILIYGGHQAGANVALGDTWELSSSGWRTFAASTALMMPAMTYDADRHQFVRFGGVNGGTASSETALWTGTSWAIQSPASPPPVRFGAALVFDPAHHQSVLFGGHDTFFSARGDTWTWNGTTWTPAATTGPSPRGKAAAGYDYARGQVVLFGGTSGAMTTNDTWIWDGTAWHEAVVPAAARPAARASASLTWNAARQRLVLTGGTGLRLDAWEWDGTTWTELDMPSSPPSTYDAVAYPELDGSGIAVQFGQSNTGMARSEVWRLAFRSGRPSDACAVPSDNDGDSLAGCADPDCWTVCSPQCPPGTSCATGAPRCGDAACGLGESCHVCPGDCTTCTAVCGDFVCDPGESCPGDC